MTGFTFQPKPEGNHYVTIHKCYKDITDGKESTAAILSALEFLASRAYQQIVEKSDLIKVPVPESIEINGDCNSPLINRLLDGMLKPTAIKQKLKILEELGFISYEILGGKSRKITYHYKSISDALINWSKSDPSESDPSKSDDSSGLTRQKVTRRKVPQTIPSISTIPNSSIPTLSSPPIEQTAKQQREREDPFFGKSRTPIAVPITPIFAGPWGTGRTPALDEFEAKLIQEGKNKRKEDPSAYAFKVIDSIAKGGPIGKWRELMETKKSENSLKKEKTRISEYERVREQSIRQAEKELGIA